MKLRGKVEIVAKTADIEHLTRIHSRSMEVNNQEETEEVLDSIL